MYKGFYCDYFSIKESIEETKDEDSLEMFSFAFLDNINEAFYQDELSVVNFEKYLHGFCDEFAILLNKKYNYPISAIFKGSKLVHAYCKVDNLYVDIRGITDDKELFDSEFIDELREETIIKTFSNYNDFFEHMSKIISNYKIENIDELNLLEQDKWFDNYYAI